MYKYQQFLFSDIFIPLGVGDPLVINFFIRAILFNLIQKIVQPVEKIRVAFSNRPGKRFIRKRFIQKHQFVLNIN